MEIEVVTKTDLNDVKGLEELVDEIKSKAEEAVQLNIEIGEVTSQLEEATSEVERLQDALDEAHFNGDDIQADALSDELAEAESEVEKLSSQLDELNSKTVSVNFDTSAFDEASGKAEETASSMDNITTAAAGIAATAGIEQMVTTADNINNSWNRLELTFANTGVSMDTLRDKSSALSSATGRSGGTIRNYFNQMGIAGVTNTDLLTSSFEALSGKAYQTNQSIESMENKMQMMAMTGNASGRMLKSLGISADDLAKAMGVSAEEVSEAFKNMTPEERIAAITKAMGEGKQANEMYKDSYAGLKDRADAAMAGLMGAIGQAILPVVIPALQAATDAIKMLTDGFKNLPGPVQAVIGGIGGMMTITIAAVGVLGVIGNVIGGVISGFRSLKDAANIVGIADKLSPLKTALVNVGSAAKTAALKMVELGKKALMAGLKALKSVAMWTAQKLAVVASTLAEYGLAAAQTILNAVMSMNPIMLIVIALVALAAALIWAYYNVDWFRQMVDNAWASIQGFAGWLSGVFMGAVTGIGDAFNNAGQMLQNAFTGAVEFVQGLLQGLYDYIMTLGGLLPEGVNITGNQIIDSIIAVMAFIATLPIQLAMIFMNIIASALGFGSNFSQTMITNAANAVMGFIQWVSQIPSRLGSALSSAISSAVSFGSNFVSTISNAASNAVSNFVSWISQLPQRLGEELDKMIQQALDFAARLPQIIGEAAANMVGSWIGGSGEQSPGFMYDAFYGEIDEMGKVSKDFNKFLPATIGEAAKNMVNSFNPSLSNGTLNGDIANGGYGGQVNFYFSDITVDNDDRMEKIYDYITRRLHWNNKTAGRSV